MNNITKALENKRVLRTLECIKLADDILHIKDPDDIVGIYEWQETKNKLLEELSELLKEYGLSIEDIPEEMYKYNPEEEDDF